MGKTLSGSTKHTKNISMLTPQQQQQFSSFLTNLGPSAEQSFKGFLEPQSPEQTQDVFQKAYVNPAMKTYQEQILPAIENRFSDLNAGSSSALNQALASSAQDLSTNLGAQYGNLFQNQQQQQLQALSQFLPLLQNQTFSPMIQQKQGIAGPLIGAAGAAGAAALPLMFSDKRGKENVREYRKGLNTLKNLDVKMYDYNQEVKIDEDLKIDRIGVMAQDLPEEATVKIDGMLHVDLYGLIGIMINSIKELNKKIEFLEKKQCQIL